MKRLVLLTAVTILSMCTLTGCIVIPIYKNFDIDANTVESIQIYDLCENYSIDDALAPVYEIPKESTADFLSDLAKIRFSDAIIIVIAAIDPSFCYDTWTVRVNYTDGSYEFISCDGYGETFDKNGKRTGGHHFGCYNDEWWAFIGQYVPEDLFNHSHTTK